MLWWHCLANNLQISVLTSSTDTLHESLAWLDLDGLRFRVYSLLSCLVLTQGPKQRVQWPLGCVLMMDEMSIRAWRKQRRKGSEYLHPELVQSHYLFTFLWPKEFSWLSQCRTLDIQSGNALNVGTTSSYCENSKCAWVLNHSLYPQWESFSGPGTVGTQWIFAEKLTLPYCLPEPL